MPPRRENPPQPPPDGRGGRGQPQQPQPGQRGQPQDAPGGTRGRATDPPGGGGLPGQPPNASRGRVGRLPPTLGGIQPGFVQRAAAGVAGRGADPGGSESPSRVTLGGGQITGRGLVVTGSGTPPSRPSQPGLPAADIRGRRAPAAAGGDGHPPAAGLAEADPAFAMHLGLLSTVGLVPAQQQLFGSPADRAKRQDEEYSSPEDTRESSRQRVDRAGTSSTPTAVPTQQGAAAPAAPAAGEVPARRQQQQQQPAIGSARYWQREAMAVGIMRPAGEEEAQRRSGGYAGRHSDELRAEARALEAVPNADPSNPLVNYGHRKWPVPMATDTFYISVLMLDVWPRGLNWQNDATHTARCRKLIQEFQQTGLPQTVHADIKHEDQEIPHPSTVIPAYKCSCWTYLLGNLWFHDTDASLLQKLGPEWGVENQNLFLHLLKRLLISMTRHYIKNSPLFMTNNPTHSALSQVKKKSLWSEEAKQILLKVLEIKGIDRRGGLNCGLTPEGKTLVSQLTGIEVLDISKKLRGLRFMRANKKDDPPQNEDEGEGEECEEEEQPQAEQAAPPAAPPVYLFNNEENFYWDSYLLAQRVLNPQFTKSMIPPEIYAKFKKEISRFPDHPLIDKKIETGINHFLSRSRKEAPRRGLKLCTEAVAGYNSIAAKNGGAPYDPMNGINNNREWCDVAVNTTLRLLKQRYSDIQAGVPGSPSDYEARNNAAMLEDPQAGAEPDTAPAPAAPSGRSPVAGGSPQRQAPGPVPASQASAGRSSGDKRRRDGDGEEDSSASATLRQELFVGPDSAAAQYQPMLEERLQGPDNDPQDPIANLLGLSPARTNSPGPPPSPPHIPPPKPLPGPAGDIVNEFYADRQGRMSLDPDGSEPPGPPEAPGPQDGRSEPTPLEFLEMYDWVAEHHPDMLKFIRWPDRLKEFFYWVIEKWPDMLEHVRWPRVNPTDAPNLSAAAIGNLDDDNLNMNLDGSGDPPDPNINLDGGGDYADLYGKPDGGSYPPDPNINLKGDNDFTVLLVNLDGGGDPPDANITRESNKYSHYESADIDHLLSS